MALLRQLCRHSKEVFSSAISVRGLRVPGVTTHHLVSRCRMPYSTESVESCTDNVEGVLKEREVSESPAISDDSSVIKRKFWRRNTRRSGVIAIKLGMTQLWDKTGQPIATTVLQVIDNQVVGVRRREKEGYNAVQIGAIDHPKPKNILKPVLGQYRKAGVTPKRKLMEFRVSKHALLPVGTSLDASHFIPGQFVDVCSNSIGKGFQGVMKRHGMKGQPASHGVTKTHRKMGATGGGQDPGRIWPGKKMPGRMGGKRTTTQNLKVTGDKKYTQQLLQEELVYRVNYKHNVLYVRGPVPGHKNTYVRVTDAICIHQTVLPPLPTFIPNPRLPLPEERYSDDIHLPHSENIEFPDVRAAKKR